MKNPAKALRRDGWEQGPPGFWVKPNSTMAEPVPLEEAIKIYEVWEVCKKQ